MTIRHLRIFIEVAERGKMSLAARSLFYYAAVCKSGHPGAGRALSGTAV